jgi:hypothetical protein
MSRFPARHHPHYAPPAAAVRASEPVEDFAFADTIVAVDLDEPPPASGIVVSDETGRAQLMQPVAYPIVAPDDPGLVTQIRFSWVRLRHGMKESRNEMRELWSATADLDELVPHERAYVQQEDPLVRAATIGRRLRALFSFFEWDRADLLRAAWIGLAVFFLAATIGALVVHSQPAPSGLDDFDQTSSSK